MIHIDPDHLIALNKTCRYCTRCDLLIAHRDEIEAELRAHRRRQADERLALGPEWEDQDLVYPAPGGSPLPPKAVSYWLTRALKSAGLPNVRVHDLRHTAATLQLQWGTNPKVVQEMLGHSTISITLDLYSHVSPAIHREAVKRFGRLF